MLLPPELTRGRSAVRVRFEFRPVGKSVHSGLPPVSEAWSEMRYTVHSYVVPRGDY